jgi:apolipoprotein N-acyltransferase
MIAKKYLPIIYFLLGFTIFMFTRMSKLVPTVSIAFLIAPIFILRFIRTQPAKRGIWLTGNIHLFIDNNGVIQLDYAKRYLLGIGPFGEASVFKKGAEIIQSTDTPYGRIGIAICRDMGFPSYIKQAARDHVDIMLAPSYDWPKSPVPWYISNTIENGFSIVRPTYNGHTYAADYNGNVLAHMDSDETEDGLMYVDVPTRGFRTLYPIVGDLLGWLCVAGMFMFIGLSLNSSLFK